MTHLIDLAQGMPRELVASLGEAMILFGRLEHMVLLAIKRLRKIPLAEAELQYKGCSLGTKLNGNNPCPGAGDKCRNRNGQVGLRELARDNPDLLQVCDEIQDLITKRNMLMHGLMTTVADSSVVFHNKKIYSVTEKQVWELTERVMFVIQNLNELIPIPGLTAMLASGPNLDVDYETAATDPSDPLVRVINPTDL